MFEKIFNTVINIKDLSFDIIEFSSKDYQFKDISLIIRIKLCLKS